MRFVFATTILTLTFTGVIYALEMGESIGSVSFETLDGLPRTMDNYGERNGTVVVFLSTRCPETAAHIDAINDTYEKFRFREVLFVGIGVNPDESSDELRAFLQNNGVRFPVYRDPDAALPDRFNAQVTPEFFLLDKAGNLVYRGGLAAEDGSLVLENAIKTMLAGKPVKQAGTAAIGTPIGKEMPPYTGQNPFGAIRFSSTLVFDAVPGAAVHHCSTIAEAPNGDMLCLWYGGSYESAEDQALFLSRLPKGGSSWSEAERLVWNMEYPPGNAVLFLGTDNRLWIIWGRMESTRPLRRGGGWDACRLMVRYSDDNGVTWSADTEIVDSFGWLPRNPSLTLNDGTLALPVSGSCDGKGGSALLILDTAKAVWGRSGFISAGSQPTVIQRNDGSLLAYMRNQPRLLQSESPDNGQTWTAPVRSEHKNPGAGAAMLKLRSGRIVLVYNDSETERTPLCIIQSYDDGKTWQDRRILEADDGEYSYPFITQSADNTIHVTYTYRRYSIKHTAFNDAWLTHLERPN
jgi:predicted neuraminidase/peroxiredoxin